jgi:hypothetical protein
LCGLFGQGSTTASATAEVGQATEAKCVTELRRLGDIAWCGNGELDSGNIVTGFRV